MGEEDKAKPGSLGFIMPNIQIYTYFMQIIYKDKGFFISFQLQKYSYNTYFKDIYHKTYFKDKYC